APRWAPRRPILSPSSWCCRHQCRLPGQLPRDLGPCSGSSGATATGRGTTAAAVAGPAAMPREAGEDIGVKADTSPSREPIDLNGNDMAEINLHSVESISDLYWVSGGHKAAEGNGPSQSTTPQAHSTKRHGAGPALLPTLRAVRTTPICPCFRPACCRTALFALLGALVLASLALATLAVYLSVLQSESLRVLSQWLEAQEESVRQMRATSLQLWKRLNVSEARDQM
ncbi:leucine rich single-pass membrane protein 2, partial [Chelydra serpentina]